MEENRILKTNQKHRYHILRHNNRISGVLLKENVSHIINNHSLLIESLSHTVSLRVINMYTYFIIFFRVLHFYIYKGSYSNIDFKTREKGKHAD